MPNEEILYQAAGRVATITLNRPDKLNAWTRVMEREVREAMKEAAKDENVRAIVLTGAGRGFCAGADMSLLNEVVRHGVDDASISGTVDVDGDAVRPDFRARYSYFPAIPKPVIGAINGPAVGLGFVIAMFCDVRFAAASAKFGTAFARRGLIAEYGLAWLLPRLIGHAHALDLLLSGRVVGAQEGLRMGLVNQVFPDETFIESVYAYAGELATAVSPRSMRVIKRQVYDGMFQTLGQAVETATEEMKTSLHCEDFKEGVAHFLEKRAPAFTGR
jgi:enoyl-CoA hydratase/carnithine racemase